jgi:mannose-6-phosphate isomerase
MVVQFQQRRVIKPWGRKDLPRIFGESSPEPVGEIWFEPPSAQDAELLVKYLFTSERLSIQVHPGKDRSSANTQTRGKDEAWIVLHADPGAEIGLGLKRAVQREALEAAAVDGSIEALMDWRPVKAGDVLYCPAGTIHALGAGLVLIEIQQNTDQTYRLYDYGRPRELHVSQAVAVADLEPYTSVVQPHTQSAGREVLVANSSFVLERWRNSHAGLFSPAPGRPAWLVPITGSAALGASRLEPGEVWQVDSPVAFAQGPDTALLVAYPGALVVEELIS